MDKDGPPGRCVRAPRRADPHRIAAAHRHAARRGHRRGHRRSVPCREGHWGACAMLKHSGEIEMDTNDVLEPTTSPTD